MTNITSIAVLNKPASGVFSMAALALAAFFVLGALALPQPAAAADFGYGDCWDCGGSGDGWSDWYPETETYNAWDVYDYGNDGWSDWYPETETYNVWDVYDYGYGGYYPSYYGSYQNYYRPNTYSGGSNYNNNSNTNVNNNNVNVQVGGGGGNTYTPSCSDYGLSGSYPNCHGNNNNNDDEPSCDLRASDTSVDEGDRITLTWDTEDADYASINQGIGRVDEDGGSERVTLDDDDVTFRMTVRDNDGDEDTCSVTVRVDDDNDNDFSSISFDGGPVSNPPTVYLSDLPYTGIEDMTPGLWASLAMLAALMGIAGYFFFVKRSRIA